MAEPDHNTAERALRAVCLTKKNFIFFGSDHGGVRDALLYGLIGTCRLNGIDPAANLRHTLSVLSAFVGGACSTIVVMLLFHFKKQC